MPRYTGCRRPPLPDQSVNSTTSDRLVPFLRHHCVTRIDSLPRLPLVAAWTGSTPIRYVRYAEPKHDDPGNQDRLTPGAEATAAAGRLAATFLQNRAGRRRSPVDKRFARQRSDFL